MQGMFETEMSAAFVNGLIFQELTYYGTPPKFVCRIADIKDCTGGWANYYTSDRCDYPATALKNAIAKARGGKVSDDYSDLG